MKRIYLLFFSLCVCLGLSAQVIPVNRGPAGVLENDARIMGNLNLGIPKVPDTAHGLNGGLDSLGLLIQIYSTGVLYHRDTTAGGHKWSLVASGTGFSNVLDTTIAGIRALTTAAVGTLYYTRDLGQQGFWYYVPTDATSTDNTGTILVTAGNQRMYRVIPYDVNAAWWGPQTDYTLALDSAIAFTARNGYSLFIPAQPGGWPCNTYLSGTHMIDFPPNYSTIPLAIRIYGEAGTVISSTLKSGTLLSLTSGAYNNIFIDHIQFLSTHDTTKLGVTCIQSIGISPYFVKNLHITECKFTGWSTAITLKGTQGSWIDNDVFSAPKGHDNATTTTAPAVFIRMIDDSAGDLVRNTDISHNIANGYDTLISIDSTITKEAFDGFIYGHSAGMVVIGNETKNFGQETIVVQPDLNVLDTTGVLIADNNMNLRAPAGALSSTDGVSLLRQTTGIRIDHRRYSIENNLLTNATIGIQSYATSSWPYVFRNQNVHGNTIRIITDTVYRPELGINLQGYSSTLRSKGLDIYDNNIYIDSVILQNTFYAIAVTFADSGTVTGNNVIESRVTKSGGGVQGINLNTDTAMIVNSNTMSFVDTSFWVQSSTYSGNFEDYSGTNYLQNTKIRFWNTAVNPTNYGFLDIYNNGTYGAVRTGGGGSTTTPYLELGTPTTVLQINEAGSSSGFFQMNRGTSTVNGYEVQMGGGIWAASSGTNVILQLTPTWNQTGSAGFNDLVINNIETGVGSGTRNAIQVWLNNTIPKFSVSDSGTVTINPLNIQGGLLYTPSTGGVVAQSTAPNLGQRPYWNGSAVIWTDTAAGGGGGNPNSNIGSGDRWAVPGTNNIKTIFGVNIKIDSTTNTNGLTITDTLANISTLINNVGYLTGSTGWSLAGNAATAGVSFAGTTNNTAYRLRSHNIEWANLDSLGNINTETQSGNTNLITSWTNNGSFAFQTFTTSGANISSAITNGSNYAIGYSTVTLIEGHTYTVTFTETLNSGTAPTFGPATTINAGPFQVSYLTTNGANSYTFISTYSGTAYMTLYLNSGVSSNFAIASMSMVDEGGNINVASSINATGNIMAGNFITNPKNGTTEAFGLSINPGTYTQSVLTGQLITNNSIGATVTGYQATATANGYIYPNTFGGYPTLFGHKAYGNGTGFGDSVQAIGAETLVIGPKSYGKGLAVISIGDNAIANPTGSNGNEFLFGDVPWATGNIDWVFGGGTGTAHDTVACLFCEAANAAHTYEFASRAHQFFIGNYDPTIGAGGAGLYNDFYLGGPDSAASPHPISLNITSKYVGSDQPGVGFTINGSAGTGKGVGGEVYIATSDATTSGSTLQSRSIKLAIGTGELAVSLNGLPTSIGTPVLLTHYSDSAVQQITVANLMSNVYNKQQTTLSSGTKALSISGVTTSSLATVTLVSPSGSSLTTQYQAVCTAGTVTIQANVAAGTINTSDGSTVNVVVYY